MNFNWPTTNIFYSRRIGRTPQGSLPDYDYADKPNGTHILGAAKISGEISNSWKIGTIHAVTQREFADISLDGNRSSVEIEPLTYYGVLRAQRDFNSGNQGLGILSTFTTRFFNSDELRNTINKNALVAAADGWTFLDQDNTYVLTGWAAVSNVSGSKERITALQESPTHYFQRPDVSYISVDSSATSLTGYSGRLMLNKNRGRWIINTAVGFISPKFEVNDLGFGSYSDYINGHFFTAYRWNDPTDFYLNCGINAAAFLSFDYGGNKVSQGYWGDGYLTLHDYYGSEFSFIYSPTTLNSRRTRGGPLTVNPSSTTLDLNLYTDGRKWWVLNFSGETTFGEDENSRSIETNVEFKVLPTLTCICWPSVHKRYYYFSMDF